MPLPLLVGAAIFCGGCAGEPKLQPSAANTHSSRSDQFMAGESMVLIGESPASLAFTPLRSKPFQVRSTYRDNLPATIHYEVGRDYLLDAAGHLQRTHSSSIPDFQTNVLCGREDFDHGKFPGYGNSPFFVYCDYFVKLPKKPKSVPASKPLEKLGVWSRLPRAREKLEGGHNLRILAFGDSITAGGEASAPELIYWNRWAEALRKQYPRASIEAVNAATGGDTTVQGLQRLQEKVLSQRPDVVLVAFGMNDHNREGYGVPLDLFRANLTAMVERIRTGPGAEVILVSAFPPNPQWHFGSHNMVAYADATEAVAVESRCALADVYHSWMRISARKRPEDLLANNINHPNDFGHWIYFQALQVASGPADRSERSTRR